VAFAEEEGDRGPQASTVKLVGRHGDFLTSGRSPAEVH
jgi:hypothetical protein